jgi:hypothetical protein
VALQTAGDCSSFHLVAEGLDLRASLLKPAPAKPLRMMGVVSSLPAMRPRRIQVLKAVQGSPQQAQLHASVLG